MKARTEYFEKEIGPLYLENELKKKNPKTMLFQTLQVQLYKIIYMLLS